MTKHTEVEKLKKSSTSYTPVNWEFAHDYSIKLLRALHWLTAGLFGRGYNLSVKTIMMILPNKRMKVAFSNDSIFLFDLKDFYWNKLLLKHYIYEPELEFAFKFLKNIDYTFLDCGANMGYWSILASSQEFGNKECIAIEASPETFKKLTSNCAANNSRFKALHNAIYHENDHVFSMSDAAHHAGREISQDHTDNIMHNGSVRSITLDTIASQQDIQNDKKLVIKLDVEGQEVNALKGANRVFEHEFLLAYEDHAKDQEHTVTKFIMNELDLAVFYIDQELKTIKINSANELNKIKTGCKGIGYNFFACKKESFFSDIFNSL